MAFSLAFVAFWTLGPFIWIVISSFLTKAELLNFPPHWIPENPTNVNYIMLLAGNVPGVYEFAVSVKGFLPSLRNSIIVSTVTTMTTLTIGAPAGYAIARLRFPGRRRIVSLLLSTRMVPAVATIIPLYILMKDTGLLDTWWVLVILFTSFFLPFIIFILERGFRVIPMDLEEAAYVDGCTRLQTFRKIILPLSGPALVAAGIFAFLAAWSDFFYALIFTSSYSAKTAPVVVTEFITQFQVEYPLMCAASVLASIPPVVVALVFQKYMIRGLLAGVGKGVT